MRLIITGKSRSGKSTALHRLIRSALQACWSQTLLADGKSVELLDYATDTCHVYGDDEAEALAAALTATADRLTVRYQALRARKLLKAPAGDPHELLIIDEVQEFTRHPKYGKAVRDALTRIFEKSGALGDLVIIASQRATNAIPPSVRVNANAELRMLGVGFFQFIADGFPTRQGRVDPTAPLAGPDRLTPADLMDVLSAQVIAHPPTQIIRYEGAPGSGRTYALAHHPTPSGMRRIYLDCRIHTHKSLLIDSLHQCGATTPADATIADLADAAALALESAPSLLLLDNVTDAGGKLIGSLHQLLDAATEGAIALAPPKTEDHTKDPYASLQRLLDAASAAAIALPPPHSDDPARDPLAGLRQKAACVALQPLAPLQASVLIHQVAPTIDDASAAMIIQRAAGNPKAISAYAERIAAHGDEERHALESIERPARWLLLLVLLAAFVGIVYVQRHLVENEFISALVTGLIAMTLWLLRPRFMKLTRPQ